MNILTLSETRQAVRLGVARAFSEAGLIPSEAEAKLATLDLEKTAEGELNSIISALKGVALGSVVVGAGAGAYAGHLHHKINQRVSGEDDPEINTLRKKTDGYHKMIADLTQTQTAGAPIAV